MQQFRSGLRDGLAIYRDVSGSIYRALNKTPARTTVLFVGVIFIGAFISARWIDAITVNSGSTKSILTSSNYTSKDHHTPPKKYLPLQCPTVDPTATGSYACPASTVDEGETWSNVESPSCPEYFRWIHEDLRPWKASGITKEMVERAKRTANFRLVILQGKAYLETYQKSFQTRDVFTLWGILQLLRKYPGRIPDLELMFDCVDWPVVFARDYRGRNASAPPPLFRYCGNHHTLDIVFPDWSFWGWAEINIKPWDSLLKDLKKGNEKIKWKDREPYAFWKGNPTVAATRQDLLKCNVSDTQDWNARLYAQDWLKETQQGFKQSDLGSQCAHRYKIYIEGSAWSVSEKYILACNSPTLIVKPRYYDFFTRGLMPVHHYWPIREDDKCRSIKFAVDWGNSHKKKAQDIGNAASSFIQEELKMDYVYDYMFHLLNEYAKLFKYKPTKTPNAVKLCLESMACPASGSEKKFMEESMVTAPKDSSPCSLPPPLSPETLYRLVRRKENSIRQVESWESQNQ